MKRLTSVALAAALATVGAPVLAAETETAPAPPPEPMASTPLVRTADGAELPANWPEVVAGEHPFGHAAFRPTPDRPLGYRGCQNGWFPGATPPTSFGDGTAAQVETELRHKGRLQKETLWTLTDRRARNLRFKTPMPGWSLSQPLPVLGEDGRLRVVVKCHPWFVLCVDGETGEVLWQDELSPFHGMDLAPKEADAAAELLTLGWAVGDMIPTLLGHRNGGFDPRHKTITRQEDPDLYAKLLAALGDIAQRVKALAPEHVKDIAAAAALLREGLPREFEKHGTETYDQPFRAVLKAVRARYDVATHVWFHGYTGLAMPAPVSDGRHVYVTFGQGQVACYTLDGQRRWARLLRKTGNARSMYYASPALVGGKLIFYQAPEQKSGLVCLAADTGELLWRTDGNTPWAKVAYASIRPARLPLPGGGTLDVVFARSGGGVQVVRAADGKGLGPLCDGTGYGAGPHFMGDVFVTAFSVDGGDRPDPVVRLRATGPDTVAAETLHNLQTVGEGRKKGLDSRPFAFTPWGLFGGRRDVVMDPVAGRALGTLNLAYPDRTRGLSATVAGHYLILPLECRGVEFAGRGRLDNWALMRFAVIDVANPAAPKVLSADNVLGGPEMPAAISFDRFLAPHDLPKRRLLGAYKTILAHFGAVNAGVIPHGDMLFVQSATYLYGLGETE